MPVQYADQSVPVIFPTLSLTQVAIPSVSHPHPWRPIDITTAVQEAATTLDMVSAAAQY